MLLNLEPRLVMDGSGLPAGLADDISWINAHATTNVSDAFYSTPSLSNVGTDAEPLWDQLRPYSFQSEDPSSSTTTYTYNDGTTSTLVTHGSVSASYSTGSGSSSGDYTWTGTYVRHDDSTSTITGTDAAGHPFTEVHSRSDDINWQGSGGSSSAAHYKVTHDGTQSDSRQVNGSTTTSDTSSAEGHVEIQGDVSSSGGVTGNYSFNGDFKVGDSLSGGGGGGSDPSGLGFTANYSGTSDLTTSRQGTYQGGDTTASANIDSSETGSLVVTDANNGFFGMSRNDADTVTSSYSASASSSPNPPTKGPVDPNGPTTQLVIPTGKTTAYVIDSGDKGWLDWTSQQRQDYIVEHPFAESNLPGQGFATGSDFVKALGQSGQSFIQAYGADQIVGDLGFTTSLTGGKVDVLVISDHGAPGYQQTGQTFISPLVPPSDPTKPPPPPPQPRLDLDKFANFVAPGGTLVVTGCSVFGDQDSVDAWQAYATGHKITIMGSASVVGVGTNANYGVWITLTPGGTAPQIKKP